MVLALVLAGMAGTVCAQSGEEGTTGGRAYFDFGVFAYQSGDYAEAAEHFQTALEFEPYHPAYHHYLGRTFLARKQYEKARVHLNQALEMNPNIPGLKYDAGMVRFRGEEYEPAAALFESAAAEAPEDVLARYFAGIALFRLERYEAASDYFLAAAKMSPEARPKGRFYAGLALERSGQLDRALSLFEEVMESPDSGEFAGQAREWAAAIRERRDARRPWKLFGKVGRRYDDNVVLDPDGADLFSDQSDWGTLVYLSGRYEFLRREPFFMGAGYRHYWMDYDDLDEYDLHGSLGDLYAAYRLGAFTFRLVYAPAYYWANSESYLRRHQMGPDLLWRASSRLLLRFGYRYADNAFFEYPDRDGHDQTLFSEAYYSVGAADARLFGRLEYESRAARAADEEYGQWRIRVGGRMAMPWKMETEASVEYRARNYDAEDVFFKVKREDDRYSFGMSLSRPVWKDWLMVRGEYRYIKNNATINNYGYSRNQFTMALTASY